MAFEKVTREFLESQIMALDYFYHGTLTIAVITTPTGFKLVGESACMNPDDYNIDIGRKLAAENALNKLWALEVYHRMKR